MRLGPVCCGAKPRERGHEWTRSAGLAVLARSIGFAIGRRVRVSDTQVANGASANIVRFKRRVALDRAQSPVYTDSLFGSEDSRVGWYVLELAPWTHTVSESTGAGHTHLS